MSKTRRVMILLVATALCGVLLAGTTLAQVAREGQDTLNLLAKVSARLNPLRDSESLSADKALQAPDVVREGWMAFTGKAAGQWVADYDKRIARIEYAEGAGIPWIPGRGNRLQAADVAKSLGSKEVNLPGLEKIARGFLPQVAGMLGVDGETLALNPGRSGHPADHVWFVDFDVVRGGLPVEGARVVFRINNGNLIQFGSENLPAPGTRTPKVRISREQAYQIVDKYIGGFFPSDKVIDSGSLHLLPSNLYSQRANEGYELGRGRGLVAVWQITFKRQDTLGTFQARVDATSGELLELYDANEYATARVTGGAYQSDQPATERVLAMPWANVGTGVYTNSAGNYSWGGGTVTTTLAGQYVKITDSCGAISKSSDASGNIALGTSTATDCSSGGGGAGDTRASRTQFYMVNRGKEIGRGWLPSNTWLGAQLTVKVNLNQTCNAYWDGAALNFFKSGGGCANTGELPGVSLHEWGHGLDSNDGNGSAPDNGTGETYGDFSAALFTHKSCTGAGFLSSNCSGYGNACTACTGVRDIDWAKHSANAPSTVENFTRLKCPQPSPTNPNYVGVCGKDAIARGVSSNKREGHCESLVSSEALWDFTNRDIVSPGSGSAWAITDRLWYMSRSTATGAFVCNTSATPWTSNGCATGTSFRVFRAIDDDNGNLADGTPHGGAIYAAFNRHGMACSTDAGFNTTFSGCTPPAVPTLALTAGDNSASASFTGSTGVYDLYRNETGCSAGFTKVANDLGTTSFSDGGVANGVTYYYQAVAQPSGNEACASAPSTCMSVTPAGAPCTPPAAPTGVTATSSSQTAANVSWTASSGATSYTILRSTTSGGPYTQVGTATGTSFADSGLSCNTAYYYVVTASNGTCSSGNSTQASAVTSACTGNVLTNGVPVTGISGTLNSQQTWTMAVPAGASNLQFQISGGTGDADMYVKFGSAPTLTTYDCRPYVSGNAETCTFATPQTGTYYVMLVGYTAYSGVTLVGSYSAACTPPAAPTGVSASATSQTAATVSWTASSGATSYKVFRATVSGGPYTQVGTSTTTSFSDSGLTCNTAYYYVVTASNGTCDSGNSAQASATTQACSGNVLSNGVPVTGISGATGSQQTWTMAVPSGSSNLQFQISGGTGDADMYVRFGAAPTLTTYDCRPYATGNSETCTFAAPSTGTYYVMLNGYAAYTGVTLVGSYTTGSTCASVAESETNDGISTADPLTAPCSTVNGTFVGETGTSDYFSMSIPNGKTVTALLNGLSYDYDLYIYNSAGSTLASSTNSGTTADQASYTNSSGASITVYVRVYKYATTRYTYTLKVSYP